MIKPGLRERRLLGAVLQRIEEKGLDILALRLHRCLSTDVDNLYAQFKDKPFFGELAEYILSGPVLLLCIGGVDAISHMRNLVGATDPLKAGAGTIRGDFALALSSNAIHASDSEESANRELPIFFSDKDIIPFV